MSTATTLTAADARQLTARIRDALSLADDLLAQAFDGRAWAALGHASWDDYCARELPGLRMIRLSKVAQSERFAALAQQGMSTHAIASAYGVSQGTVRNRLKGVERPATVRSLDGITRPSRMQRPDPLGPLSPTLVEELTQWQTVVRHVVRAGARGLTCFEFERRLRWGHGKASAAFHAAERKGYVTRDGQFRDGYGVYLSR